MPHLWLIRVDSIYLHSRSVFVTAVGFLHDFSRPRVADAHQHTMFGVGMLDLGSRAILTLEFPVQASGVS